MSREYVDASPVEAGARLAQRVWVIQLVLLHERLTQTALDSDDRQRIAELSIIVEGAPVHVRADAVSDLA